MSTFTLIRHQFRYDRTRFRRDPAGLGYAIGFPLIFLFIFVAVLGNNEETGRVGGRTLASANYYLPGIITLSVVSVTFVNLAVTLTTSRERGTLKRVRGTPLPAWVFIAGRIATAITVTVLLVVVVVAVGALFYDVEVPTATLPGALLALVLGAAAFCCLAFALTIITPSPGAASAIAFALSLVLYFISGLFARNDTIPSAVQQVADLFPVKHLFAALAIAFDSNTAGTGVAVADLAVLAAWGVAGFLVAIRFFRWSPASE